METLVKYYLSKLNKKHKGIIIIKSLLILLNFLLIFQSKSMAQDYCLGFDGSASSYGSFPSDVQPLGSSFSSEAWVYLDAAGGGDQKVLINLQWGPARGFAMNVYKDANGFYYNASIYLSGTDRWTPNSAYIPVNTWAHIAMTWTSNGNITAYLNGALVGSTSTSSYSYSASGGSTYFGGGGYNWANFKGKIDEIRIWSTARTQAEIQGNMSKVLTGSETGLVHYYKMTNGSGTTLSDNKGSSNGTLSSTSWITPGVPLLPVQVYVAGTYTACYGTLKAAFDAINAGTHSGAITLKLTESTTETAPAVLNASLSGSANYSSVNIYPATTGLSISGNLAFPLIDLNGSDNVTIDGRVNGAGSTKDLIINNTSTSGNGGTSTIRLYNGANNNTIKYCSIKGSSTDGSGGIIFLSATAANTGNLIDNNNITSAADSYRPINSVYSGGAANTVTISNNCIYDFFSRTNTSYGINLNSSTAASTISGNSFYETSTLSPTSNRISYYPIYINSSASGFTISGNYIGGSAPLCSGTWTKANTAFNYFCGINLYSVGTGTPSVVKGNTINCINWSNNSNDNSWLYGISVNAGDVTLGSSGEPNTIGSITGTPNLTFTNESNGNIFVPICLNGSGYITCQYNNIGGITCNNTNSSHVTRLFCIYRGNSNVNAVISNNTIGSSTNPITCTSPASGDTQYMIGIWNANNATSGLTMNNNSISYLNNQATSGAIGYVCGILSYDMSAPLTISGNSIHDLTISNTNGGSGRDASMRGGIWVTTGSLLTLTNNTVYNLTNTNTTFNGYMYGIYCSGGTGGNDVSGNTVYNIKATGSGAGPFMYGIYFYAGNQSSNTIARNYVYGFSCSGTTTNFTNTRYYGLYKQNSSVNTVTFANNIISFGGNNISSIYGIYEEGGAGCVTNAYFNTLYISGSPTTGNLPSYGIYSSSNITRNYKNNIFYNARSNNGSSGNHYCIFYGSTPATSDYNDLYAPGTGGMIGYYNGNYCTTLPSWRTATGGDANSLNTNPIFVSGFKTAATLNGVAGTGITTDYEGTARGNPPRMGAYESAGVITYTWTGATSSAYNTATNWELNVVPPDGTDFSFAASPVNHCLLDQNRTLGNVTNASGKDLSANGYQITLGGSTNFTSTGTIDATASGSTVVYSGSTAQSFTSGLFKNNTVYNLRINNANGLTQNGTLTVTNDLTLTSGVYTIGANTLNVNGGITYTSGSLTGGSSSNLTFGGSGASTNLAAITLNSLTLNRSNGINISGDVTINNTLTLTDGLLNTGSNVLTFSATATNPVETCTSRIVGTSRIMNVPVGTGGFEFLGFKMYPGADNLGNVNLVRKTGTAGIVTIGANTSIASNWDVTTDNQPVSGRNIEYKWLCELDNGKAFCSYNKGVNYYSTNGGTNWVELGTHIDVSASNPRVMSITTTHFSQWVSTGENSPLPVTLQSLNSSVNGRNVSLNWVTSSEINNAGFEVERAEIMSGNLEFRKTGFVKGKGTTNTQTNYSFTESKLNTGKYRYRLKQTDVNGNFEYFELNNVVEILTPDKFEISQNYPNPFNPITKIDYALPFDSKVKIVVYDITGREVKVLVNEARGAGYHTATFDASGLSSGMYVYRIIAKSDIKEYTNARKLMLIK